MPRKPKRPTEATWDSDDDLLNDEVGINTAYATKGGEYVQEELDEEALLAYSDDEIQVVAEDEIEQTEEVVEEVYVEQVEEEVLEESQDVQGDIHVYEEIPVEETYHTEQPVMAEASQEQVPDHVDDESDSGSDSDSGGRRRARFQSERVSFEKQSKLSVTLSTASKKEIPDTLPDISAEDQAKIDKYLTKGGGRGRGRGQGRGAWGQRGGHYQVRPRVSQPIITHPPPMHHMQHHVDRGQHIHHVRQPVHHQQQHQYYHEQPQPYQVQHVQPVHYEPPVRPVQHVQHVQQPVQHVQQPVQHVQHVAYEPPRPQQPVIPAPAPQPAQTTKIHINPHFKPKVDSPRPAWEPPRSQPAPQYVVHSQPQPVPQHYPPRSEPVHHPVQSHAWSSTGHDQHYARPQYTVPPAPVSYVPAPAPVQASQPYQPPPQPTQPPYQPPPQPAYSHSAPGMQPPRYQAPQPVHHHPGPPQHLGPPPGPPPPQHHYHPPPRHEQPRPPPPGGPHYHQQPMQHVHVEQRQPPIHAQPQVSPIQARPQVAQVRPRQQVVTRPVSHASSQQYTQPQVSTIQTVIGRKKKPGLGYNQQPPFTPVQSQPRQPFQSQNRQQIQVAVPRKRLSDGTNPNVEVTAPKLAKIERELPQNNIRIETVSSEPVDEEYQRKLEEQKRLRDEVKRKKEERRLMMSSVRKEQVQKTLAEQGIQVTETMPPGGAAVNQAVKVIERRPVNQRLNLDEPRHQNQNVVTQVPIQENIKPRGQQVIRTSGPGQQVPRQPGPGRHLLVARKVYKLITLKDGRKIRQLVSSSEPQEVSGPPPQQPRGIVKVVHNPNARRFPGPPGPQQRMLGPRPGPRPGFRPFQGPRLYKQFQGQGHGQGHPPGPGPRLRGPPPGHMGPRFRGPGPQMMRFSGPHRPPMGMPPGPRKMMRGPPPRLAVPPGGPPVKGAKSPLKTGIKRTVNTAQTSQGSGDGVTNPKRVVVNNTPVKKSIGDGTSQSVSIENLSSSTSLVGIRKLCNSIGPLESLKLDAQQKKAIAKFTTPTNASQFVEKYNRHMVDLSLINLSLIM